jgi:hypothetical protein
LDETIKDHLKQQIDDFNNSEVKRLIVEHIKALIASGFHNQHAAISGNDFNGAQIIAGQISAYSSLCLVIEDVTTIIELNEGD